MQTSSYNAYLTTLLGCAVCLVFFSGCEPGAKTQACNSHTDCDADSYCAKNGLCTIGARPVEISYVVDAANTDLLHADRKQADLANVDGGFAQRDASGRDAVDSSVSIDAFGFDRSSPDRAIVLHDTGYGDRIFPDSTMPSDIGGVVRGVLTPGAQVMQGSRYRLTGQLSHAKQTLSGQRYTLQLQAQRMW